jgi:hypothetical protein
VAWLLIGRRRGPAPVRGAGGAGGAGGATPSEWHRKYDSGGEDLEQRRAARRQVWVAPDDNPEFLRSLSELNKQNRDRGDGGAAPSEGDQ